MVSKILANPNNWFPSVDQVDRPYFIVIDNENRVFSEYTNFNLLSPVTSPENNWYEHVDKKNVQFFVVKGRFGYYWLDFQSGLIFLGAQHQEGDHPLQHYVMSAEVQGQLLTAKFIPDKEDNFSGLPYKLKHFKVSEQSLQGGDRNEQNIDIQGMNTRGINPRVKSRVLNVVFGWELDANDLGRITFEGVVSNRYPRFDLRLLYSMPLNSPEKEMKFRLLLWDATKKEERFKSKRALVRKGIRVRWQERIL